MLEILNFRLLSWIHCKVYNLVFIILLFVNTEIAANNAGLRRLCRCFRYRLFLSKKFAPGNKLARGHQLCLERVHSNFKSQAEYCAQVSGGLLPFVNHVGYSEAWSALLKLFYKSIASLLLYSHWQDKLKKLGNNTKINTLRMSLPVRGRVYSYTCQSRPNKTSSISWQSLTLRASQGLNDGNTRSEYGTKCSHVTSFIALYSTKDSTISSVDALYFLRILILPEDIRSELHTLPPGSIFSHIQVNEASMRCEAGTV